MLRTVQGAEVISRALRTSKLFFSAGGRGAQTALTQAAHSREMSPNSHLSPLRFSGRSHFRLKPQTHLFQHDHKQYVTLVLCQVISTGHAFTLYTYTPTPSQSKTLIPTPSIPSCGPHPTAIPSPTQKQLNTH